jgi:hypothetical protein
MKRLLAFAAAVLVASGVSAQSKVGDVVNYYGVDFTRARVFGAAEAGWELKEAFIEINSLVIGEWTKYNPGVFFGQRVEVRDITPTGRVNRDIDPDSVVAGSSAHAVTKEQIAEMVRRYSLKESQGTGMVIVAGLLDKSALNATFTVVWFDIAGREVLAEETISGKPRGFGLRNYWAGALYAAMRNN